MWPRLAFAAKDGLAVMLLLPPPSESWDYRHGPTNLVHVGLRWSSGHAFKVSTLPTELQTQRLFVILNM